MSTDPEETAGRAMPSTNAEPVAGPPKRTRRGGMLRTALSLAGGAQVLTVDALQQQLARDLEEWAGQIVVVRARAVANHYRLDPHDGGVTTLVSLLDTAATERAGGLPLARGPADSLLSVLRRLPLLGRIAPTPQRPRWDAPAT